MIEGRERLFHLGTHPVELRPHLVERAAAAGNYCQVAIVRGARVAGNEAEGEKHIYAAFEHGERGRQDTHHRVGLVAQPDRPAGNGRVAREAPLPQRVAQQYDIGVARRILFRTKAAPHCRLYAQQREQTGRNALALEFFGIEVSIGAAGQADLHILDGRHIRGVDALTPRQEIGGRDEQIVPVLREVLLPNHQQTLRLGKRQWLEQHRVHNAENGGSSAHTERQGEQGYGGEARGFTQQANPVPQILPGKVHGLSG